MNSPTNLDTLLKEILITPLVGAMVKRGIKMEQPTFCKCGDERCEHGGCENEHCQYFCTRCQQRREANREAAYQRDVAGPLLGLDEEAQ